MQELELLKPENFEPVLLFWPMFFVWLASFLLTDYFRESLPSQTPSGLGDFTIPTATEGRYVSLVFGTMIVQGPNVVWYGDFEAVPRTVKTGIIFTKDEVIGFTYRLGLQMGLCRGQTAGIRRVWVGDDVVWDYTIDNGGVLGSTTGFEIDRDDIFGGIDNGGGLQAFIRLFDGSSTQGFSAYLQGTGLTSPEPTDRITNLPSYRGYSYLTMANIEERVIVPSFGINVQTVAPEIQGANIGESNTLRNMKFELQMFDTVANGGLGDALSLGNDHHFIGDDINPIVLAYEAFTNTDWGRGLSPSDVNLTNFQANAETIWSEGLGFSTIIDNVQKVSALIDTIEQHIDGYIGPNPVTGQLEVNLARQDYTLASELQLDETNVISVSKFARSEGNQTFNELRVQYTDRQKQYKDGYAPAQDLANLIIQGRPRSRTQRYPGVHEADVANKIVWRDLRGMARSLASCTVETKRIAWDKRPGDIVSLTDAEVGVTNLPCRIIAVRQGDPVSATIILDVVEDIFGSEFVGFTDPPASEFIPPNLDPDAYTLAAQLAMEAPFIMNINDPNFPLNFPRLFTSIRSANPIPLRYEVNVDQSVATSPTGFDVEGTITNGATTVGLLRNAMTAWQDGNGTFTIDVDPLTGPLGDLIGLQAPGGVGALTGVAVINPNTATEEWILITEIIPLALSPEALAVTLTGVYRAGLDTAMHDHSAGEEIWFIWTGGTGIVDPTYAVNNTLDVKLLPISSTGRVNLTDSPEPVSALPVVIGGDERYVKPLLPIEMVMNDVNFPTGDVDFDAVNTPVDQTASPNADYQGVQIIPQYRWFRVENTVWQVTGLDLNGSDFGTAEVIQDQLRVSWWLYNLDDTPSPTRGVDEIDSAVDVVLTGPNTEIALLKTAIQASLTVNSFNARLEVETSHCPQGFTELSPQFRDSYQVMNFDFTGIGVFVIPLTAVYLHVRFDGDDGSREIHDAGFFGLEGRSIGDTIIDTTESVFGASSAFYASNIAGGQFTDIAGHVFARPQTSPEFDMSGNSGNDWTIEARVRFDPTEAFSDQILFADYNGISGDLGFIVLFDISAGQWKITYSPSGIGTLSFIINPDSPGWFPSPILGQFYSVAIQQKGIGGGLNEYSVFIDGVKIGGTTNSTAWNNPGGTFELGVGCTGYDRALGPQLNNTFHGNIDEFRLTYGFAIYGIGYTEASETFPSKHDNVALLMSFNPRDTEGGLTEESIFREGFTFGGTTDITNESPFAASPFADDLWSLQCNGVNSTVVTTADGAYMSEFPSPVIRPQFDFGSAGKNDFTMECFVKFDALPSSTTDGMALIAKYNRPPANAIDWAFYFDGSDNLVFFWSQSGGLTTTSLSVSVGSPILATGIWYHCAVTREGNDCNLWFEGNLIAHGFDLFTGVSDDLVNQSGQPVSIGRLYDVSVASRTRALNGQITEPRIINDEAVYLLTQSPLLSPPTGSYVIPTAPFTKPNLYGKNGVEGPTSAELSFLSHWEPEGSPETPTDESTNARVITMQGGALLDTSVFKFGTSSLRVTGISSPVSYASVPDSADWDFDNADFTMETWVAFNSLPATSPEGFATFFGQWDENSNDRVWRLGYHQSKGLIWQQSVTGADIFEAFVPYTPTLSPITFDHVAVVKKDEVLYFFINGVLQATPQGFRVATTPPVSQILGFGSAFNGTTQVDALDGWLDETRITIGWALWTDDFAVQTDEYDWHRVIFQPGPDRRVSEFSPFADYSPIATSVQAGSAANAFNQSNALFQTPSPDDGSFPQTYVCNNADVEWTYDAAQALDDDPFTIEFFVSFDDNPFTTTQSPLGHWEATGNDRSWGVRFNATSDTLEFFWSTDGIVDKTAHWIPPSPFGTSASPVEFWHIAIVRDNTVSPIILRAYVDGVELTPASPSDIQIGSDVLHDPNPAGLTVGSYTDGADSLDGRLEEIRVMKKVKYSGTFTPPTERLPRY